MAEPLPISVPSAPSGSLPPGMMPPGAPMQIMLPPQLQEIMQKFPEVMVKVSALEARPVGTAGASTTLVAALAYLSGLSTMATLVWLWFYAAVIFRL